MPLKRGNTLCVVDVELNDLMLLSFTLAAVSLLASTSPLSNTATQELFAKYGKPQNLPPFSVVKEFEIPTESEEKRLVCKSCNPNEQRTLSFFQDRGITDRNALAAILGNIRQESTFVPNICEGGARVSYHGCRYGGYGLIQWTSTNRYKGLGNFAAQYGGSPSTLDTQLRYLVNEVQWKRIEPRMKQEGRSIDSYMNTTYSWIGWGHHGYRTRYAYDYAKRFTLEV